MASPIAKSGTLERTPRGYAMDVEAAMGTDPVRAIVELVTNADDAYTRLAGPRKGKIRIEVERRRYRRPTTIKVLDRAVGMSADEMELSLGREGDRTSGFESGVEVRGLLGRGAKDIVQFGPASWTSHKDGFVTEFRRIYRNGPTPRWELTAPLPARGRGTTVELEVQPQLTVPSHVSLARKRRRHYQLRPILADRSGREVVLVDVGQKREEHLVYLQPLGRPLVEGEWIDVPGFDQRVQTWLWEASESLDDGEPREYWQHSVVIESRRAAYDVYDGRYARDPWFGRLFGRVDAPGIAALIAEFDASLEQGREPPVTNPLRLIRRDRQGLAREHPFTAALIAAIERVLEPHIRRLKDDADAGGGAVTQETRQRFKRLGKLLSELAAEEEMPPAVGEGEGSDPPLGLTVIPTSQLVAPGRAASFFLRYRPAEPIVQHNVECHVSVLKGGDRLSTALLLSARGDWCSATFRTAPLERGETALLTFSANEYEANGLATCGDRPVPDVNELRFEHRSYSVRDGQPRRIRLLAPWSDVADEVDVQLRTRGDPAVRILEHDVGFQYDESRECGALGVLVVGSRVGASGVIEARVGEQAAVCDVAITAPGTSGFDIELLEDPGIKQRAFIVDSRLIVNASHPSVARYLGARAAGWPGQHDVHFRTMCAEMVASTFARWAVLNRKDPPREAARLLTEYQALVDRVAARVHAVLVSSAEARHQRNPRSDRPPTASSPDAHRG